MKKIITVAVLLLIQHYSFCQLNAVFKEDTISIERDKLMDLPYRIKVDILALNPAAGPANTISFAVNASPATTLAASDFLFNPLSVTPGIGISGIYCPVTILHGENSANSTLFLSVQMTYNNAATQIKTVVLKVSNKKGAESGQNDKMHIMYLNAYNFDFGSSALSSNYVGHLNFFAPSSSKNKKWGFNAGVLKINYSQKDTTYNVTLRENTFINPFDTLAAGLKYLKQINGYKTEKRNTVWSFYVQPTFELTNSEDKFHVYAHAHLELLATKWSSTTTITNIKQDTGVFTQPSGSFVIRSNVSNTSTYKVNALSGYFGLGFTFDITPWDGGSFFFQPTIGITSNKPSPSSTEISVTSGSFSASKGADIRSWNSFYLVRAYYRHVIAKEKATAVIGLDIRGLLPLYAPQYALYAGLNLSLDAVFGLLKSDK